MSWHGRVDAAQNSYNKVMLIFLIFMNPRAWWIASPVGIRCRAWPSGNEMSGPGPGPSPGLGPGPGLAPGPKPWAPSPGPGPEALGLALSSGPGWALGPRHSAPSLGPRPWTQPWDQALRLSPATWAWGLNSDFIKFGGSDSHEMVTSTPPEPIKTVEFV